MKKKRIILILFCLLGIGIIVSFVIRKQGDEKHHSSFATSHFAPYAYQIAPGSLSKQAKAAIAHFQMNKKKLANNELLVTIRPNGPYVWKTYHLKKGYILYMALLPDAEGEINDTTNFDYLRYDVPVLVDDKGYIIDN